MQNKLLKERDHIMIANGVLIVLAFINKWFVHYGYVTESLLLIASIIGVLPILIQAYQALKVKVISIDLLVTLAIAGAFVIQEYEESAIVAFLFLLGAYLEKKTLSKTRSAISNLVNMAPETALRLDPDGKIAEVDIDDIEVGDILLVKTGAKVPVDGTVIEGSASVNEASITGEAIPVTKNVQTTVYAGTILENGTLKIKANKVGEDTTFGKIIELVEEAQDSKSEAEKFIDKFSKYYTPAVLLLSIIVWLISRNLELAVTILVLGCPGALVIGVPVSNVSGIGNGARNGVLLKGSEVITSLSHVNTIFFDKTGTLTYGTPKVSEIKNFTNQENYAQELLVSLETQSDHPLAKAITNYFSSIKELSVTDTQVIKGGGVAALVDGHSVIIGSRSLMEQREVSLSPQVEEVMRRLERSGNSIVLEAVDDQLALVIGIKDQIRQGIKKDLTELKRLGVKNLILLSGDNQGSVDLVAKELGLTAAFGNLLPEDKVDFVKKRQEQGEIVAFVGDGINDSPSLALADIGIAMGGGTDVAIETSNVVLMNSDFRHLPHALGLAKATYRNMVENIVIALLVVAVLLLSVFFSSWMNMAIGMFVHEASILVVIFNGMRLLNFKNKANS